MSGRAGTREQSPPPRRARALPSSVFLTVLGLAADRETAIRLRTRINVAHRAAAGDRPIRVRGTRGGLVVGIGGGDAAGRLTVLRAELERIGAGRGWTIHDGAPQW